MGRMTEPSATGGVVCRVGDLRFVLDVAVVREVCTGIPVVRVPGVAAPVEGVANVRGTLVTVIRGSAAVAGAAVTGVSPWLVVLSARGGRVGLGVDEVLPAGEARPTDTTVDPRVVLDRVLGEVKS